MSLHDLHLLNTRPAHQAAALTDALRAAGATVSEWPLVAIAPRELSPPENRLLMELDRYEAVFFVSANAARLGLDAVASFWPQWPHRLPAYAVGEGTAQVLRAAGLVVHVPARADSEGLLALPELQALAEKKLLLLRGVGGRELLPRTLRERGARLDVIELYARTLPTAAQQTPPPAADVVILTSPDALRHWQAVAGAGATRPAWLVVSPRLEAQAEAAGARAILAPGAATTSIVVALERFAAGE